MGHTDGRAQQSKARAQGRSLRDFDTLSRAELALLDSCRIGEVAKFGADKPTEPNEENTVRAGFIRFLLLGGDDQVPIHEHGIQLHGAYILESLNLEAASVWYDFCATSCTFAEKLELTDANFKRSVKLTFCEIPGLEGRRMIVGGMVSMRGVKSKDTVSLDNSQIGGQLLCSRAELYGKEGAALTVDAAVIRGNVLLDDGFRTVGKVSFNNARVGGDFISTFASLDGNNDHALSFIDAVIKGSVILHGGFRARGTIHFMNVRIGSDFICSNASLDGNNNTALCLDKAVIRGSVFLQMGFTSVGAVRLMGTQIGGQLQCSGASLDGKDGDALSADRVVITDSVLLCEGFKALGTVHFTSAKIGGHLNCSSASLDGKDGEALSVGGAVIKGGVFLQGGFKAVGKVSFNGSQIDGQLNCIGARLDGKDDYALSVDRAEIKGNVLLRERFESIGAVRLTGTQIGGELSFREASLNGKNGDALIVDRSVIKGNVLLNGGFEAVGRVCFLGSQIDGQLDCIEASLDGKDGDALVVEWTVIKGAVLLRKVQAEGLVAFMATQINGLFDCSGARFDGSGNFVLSVKETRVDGILILRNLPHPLHKASFAGTKVAVLNDDEYAWGSDLDLNGFVYNFLDNDAPIRAASRLAWLDKQTLSAAGNDGKLGSDSRFRPHPWRHLQYVLKQMGHTEEALEVGLAFERRLRKAGLIGQPPGNWCRCGGWLYSAIAKALHSIYGALTGYGYRPMLLLGWFLFTWLTCASFYWWAAEKEGVFAPSNPIVFQHANYQRCRPDRESVWRKQNPPIVRTVPKEFTGPGNWYLCEELREEYTALSPLAFSLDVLLPLVDLHQEKDWAPLIPTPKTGLEEITAFGWKYLTRWVIWFQTLFGWLCSLLLVAMVSGLTRRKE
ncbi:hypothetical protein [Pseudomonas ogarae]|uniref:hypothetical protein n=1 Tax=Pseudomonas ogarae (strain DSM 112162 / CECT 30235 / F113) TaxID=1114970 RepID=UPI001F1B318D|nr:hypothetical protein [Pseudomonas ogarae]